MGTCGIGLACVFWTASIESWVPSGGGWKWIWLFLAISFSILSWWLWKKALSVNSETAKGDVPPNLKGKPALLHSTELQATQEPVAPPGSGMVPEPPPEMLPLNTEILRLLVGLENQHRRPMTNSDVHNEFLDVATQVLDERLIHLEGSGYITATVTPTPTLGIPELKKIEIHGLKEKGRKAIW